MARKRQSPEEIVAKLRQVEALRSGGKTCAEGYFAESVKKEPFAKRSDP